MVWTPDKIEELTRQWNAGLSITQIGKSLGMTRNAVVGKAHRIGLDKRASPIVRAAAPAIAAAAVAPPPKQVAAARPPVGTGPRCKWPIGDPKSAEFGFCQSAALDGRPYCAEHCAQAYTGWGEQQDKASNAA